MFVCVGQNDRLNFPCDLLRHKTHTRAVYIYGDAVEIYLDPCNMNLCVQNDSYQSTEDQYH